MILFFNFVYDKFFFKISIFFFYIYIKFNNLLFNIQRFYNSLTNLKRDCFIIRFIIKYFNNIM